jgi:hypothetical protein
MITSKIEYGLKGAFKVDTFNASGEFVETTDWFDNFITQSGLNYPTIYSFANCFRFLTIGTNSTPNRGGFNYPTDKPTSGCESPLLEYWVTDGATDSKENGTWIGYKGYETGINGYNSACTTSFIDPRGPRFFRAWHIPTGEGKTISKLNENEMLNIQELAVSPGSGTDPTGRFAFSRITRNLPIKAGYSVIITYQLQMNLLNNQTSGFSKIFYTGDANTEVDNDIVGGWSELSGYYRQVWCGLSCIDKYGVSFIPKYGNGMEPSLTNLNKYFLYLSPDNAAFDVSPSGGYIQDSNLSYASNGLMKPIVEMYPNLSMDITRESLGNNEAAINNLFYGPEILNAVPNSTFPPVNIRLGAQDKPLQTPDISNYSRDITAPPNYTNDTFNYQIQNRFVNAGAENISFATVGGSGIDVDRAIPQGQRAVFSSRMYRLPMDMSIAGNNLINGRNKKITRKTVFPPASSLGYNNRFGSMVFAYLGNSEASESYIYYPIIDTLFYDSSGRSLMQHYRLISGIHLTQRGSGIIQCKISITPEGENIKRFNGRYTFQGPLSGSIPNIPWASDPDSTYRLGNIISGWNGNGHVSLGFGSSGNLHFYDKVNYPNSSGWGSIFGVMGDDYNDGTYPYDVGLIDHSTGSLIAPVTGDNPSSLYWPRVYHGQSLRVHFSDIVFSGAKGLPFPDDPSYTTLFLAGKNFCRPTGFIAHYDNIGLKGYRLLPNHGRANNIDNNKYPESDDFGGAYPALSFDNGIEVYMDISWSGDCRGADPNTCK